LELQGFIKAGTPIYTQSRFKPLCSSEQMLASFDTEQANFMRGLLSCSKKAKVWFSLDNAAAMQKTGATQSQINQAMALLAERQFIELQATGVKVPYQVLQHPADLGQVQDALWQQMTDREDGDIARMDQVEELVTADGCQATQLSAHFGETLSKPCGQCSWCERGPASINAGPGPAVSDEQLRQIALLRAEHGALFEDHRALARLLVGVSSPALSRARLGKHPLFGCLAEVPFAEVRQLLGRTLDT